MDPNKLALLHQQITEAITASTTASIEATTATAATALIQTEANQTQLDATASRWLITNKLAAANALIQTLQTQLVTHLSNTPTPTVVPITLIPGQVSHNITLDFNTKIGQIIYENSSFPSASFSMVASIKSKYFKKIFINV